MRNVLTNGPVTKRSKIGWANYSDYCAYNGRISSVVYDVLSISVSSWRTLRAIRRGTCEAVFDNRKHCLAARLLCWIKGML